VGVCVFLERDEGQLLDADCGCAESEHQNRGDISFVLDDERLKQGKAVFGYLLPNLWSK